MKKKVWSFIVLTACLYSLLSACSTLQPPVVTDQGKGKQTVQIKASSFKFEPNNLVTYQGDIIVFKIENISGSTHNFTLEDAAGKVLQNIDLPAGKTIDVEMRFSDLGIYKFYCAKPMHTTFGMSGQISVVSRKNE